MGVEQMNFFKVFLNTSSNWFNIATQMKRSIIDKKWEKIKIGGKINW